jgi:hypothetical protein
MRIYLTAMLGAPNSHSGAARNPGGVKGMTAPISGSVLSTCLPQR